jgi:hypothetical protein
MFIVNGRVGNDKNIGRFTCRNASVVDYCITSPELLKLFFDFDVSNIIINISVFDQINKISVSCRPRVKVPQKTYIFRFI